MENVTKISVTHFRYYGPNSDYNAI